MCTEVSIYTSCHIVVTLFAISIDDDRSLLSLEDRQLRTAIVHHQGEYVEPAFGRFEELTLSISEYLRFTHVGEKIMISDTHEQGHGDDLYVVRLFFML